jgi:hypothetical protein
MKTTLKFSFFTLLMLLMQSCLSSGSRTISSKELVRMAYEMPYNRENWYYCGTDATYHHFITRIGGNSSSYLVPKEQIKLRDETPLPPSGVMNVRQVFPDRGFAFGLGQFEWYYSHQ